MTPTLKHKYRVGKQYKRTPYRPRTGPKCCNVNCPADRTKRGKPKLMGMAA